MTTAGRRFVFAPLERRGLLLGLAAGQLGALAFGALAVVLALHAAPGMAGIGVALALFVTSAVGACLPVAGRPPVSWLPVGLSWAQQRRRGSKSDPSPTAGTAVAVAAVPPTTSSISGLAWRSKREPSSEGTAGRRRRTIAAHSDALGTGVEILSVPEAAGQPAMAVLRDRRYGTWAAALPVRGRAFALLDRGDKERRLGAWGSVLAGLARGGSPIHRVQWVERSFAGDGDALSRYLASAAPLPSPGQPPLPSSQRAARTAYAAMVSVAGPATLEHEAWVVLAVHPRRSARALRSFGRGPDGMVRLLQREIRLLQGQLRGAELLVDDPLDEMGLIVALRAAVDPAARRRSRQRPGGRMASSGAWPLATDEAWSCLRCDGAWYATYWVAEWPRLEVGPDFLAPLLLGGSRRSVSLTMAPVSPERARRQVEAARTAEAADEELRRRAGFLSTARRRREAEGVAQRESELADGHAEFRFSGYVTVSGGDRAGLEAACAEVEQAAQQARLELRRLYGQQREAFAWTLPMGRGLA